MPGYNSICSESSNNNNEDSKENIKSPRTRKNTTQSLISKADVGCKGNGETNLEHKQNENQEAIREKTNPKRRKNRYEVFIYICTRYLFEILSFLKKRTMTVMIFISGGMIVEKLLLMEYLRWKIKDLPFHQKTHHMNDTMNMQQI